jgi:AcrR family transcriptional regulator
MLLGSSHETRRSQKERTEETRKRLVEAAVAALLELGAARATVSEICKRAEVTSGALHHHFGSKAGLMGAVVQRLFRTFTDEHDSVGPDAPLEDRIARLVDHYWEIYFNESYFAVLEILLETRHDAELMKLVAHFRSQQIDNSRSYLRREFPDVPLDNEEKHRLVSRMIDYMRGSAIRRLYESGPEMDREIRAEATAMIEQYFCSELPEDSQ